MSTRFLMALAVVMSFALIPFAAEPKPSQAAGKLAAEAADPLADLLRKLHGEEVTIEGNITEIPLFELLHRLSKVHEVTFILKDRLFESINVQDIGSKTPSKLKATQLRGLTLHHFLTTVLGSVDATYMLKGNTIEIVPPAHVVKATKATSYDAGDGSLMLREPLVSSVVKEKPLNEVVASIAEHYDITVLFAQQAGDARTGLVTARLLNVPASHAIDLLALQADLRVVRRGAAFLITTREHADALFNERMEKERARLELEKLRQPPPPQPKGPPAKPN
jgi:hypothetical protein